MLFSATVVLSLFSQVVFGQCYSVHVSRLNAVIGPFLAVCCLSAPSQSVRNRRSVWTSRRVACARRLLTFRRRTCDHIVTQLLISEEERDEGVRMCEGKHLRVERSGNLEGTRGYDQ